MSENITAKSSVLADLVRLHSDRASNEAIGFARLADLAITAGDGVALDTLISYGWASVERWAGCGNCRGLIGAVKAATIARAFIH